MDRSSSSWILWRLEEVGSSANWTCFPLRFPDLAEEGLGFDGLGFVSLNPTMLYVDANSEGMEEDLEKMKAEKDEDEDGDEDEDADEQFERKVEVEKVEKF